ncbi:hypothetical protein WJX74_001376 [Apatococcus lobatus]|uniref:AB hydrolase-1 domain-containing protein n=1 Tax=Apatococcus lobatus TaxID=904363 RepID=A0AAW1QTK9_9CHLO
MHRPSLVLVHGSYGTAAGWLPFQAAMQSRGYAVHAVDLPWEKSPRTGGLPDLQDYVDALVSFVRSKQLKSIALVGHSFGGVVVSLATEALQKETKVLVFLDGYILQDNENCLDFLPKPFVERLHAEAAETGGWCFSKSISVNDWAASFYNDAFFDTAKKAWDKCHGEPIRVWQDRVTLPASFTNTSRPSIYVRFLDDKCLPSEHWELMAQRLPKCTTCRIPGSHFAFATQPESVATALDAALQQTLALDPDGQCWNCEDASSMVEIGPCRAKDLNRYLAATNVDYELNPHPTASQFKLSTIDIPCEGLLPYSTPFTKIHNKVERASFRTESPVSTLTMPSFMQNLAPFVKPQTPRSTCDSGEELA